jgi:sugar lactone lactonase YvrE
MRGHTIGLVERLADIGGQLLEGPCWDAGAARVLLVDIKGRQLLAHDWASAELRRIDVDVPCSAWLLRASGGTVAAGRAGLRAVGPDGLGELLVEIEADVPGNRSNDAKCDPAGRLWYGTMAEDEKEGAGSLYRIDADHGVTAVLTGVTISNGLGWSPDGGRMYYVDSPTRRVDVLDYDVEAGHAENRRPLVDVSFVAGVPDGLAVDSEGGLWVAFHDGHVVCRFGPDGTHDETLRMPAARPTSCAFAGTGLDRLVITTAAAPDGSGGDLYVCETGVSGAPIPAFAG